MFCYTNKNLKLGHFKTERNYHGFFILPLSLIKYFINGMFVFQETSEAEEELLKEIRDLKVKTDIDFFNQVIRTNFQA